MNDSMFWLKFSIAAGISALLLLSAVLWTHTPVLFEYFQQAFCAH